MKAATEPRVTDSHVSDVDWSVNAGDSPFGLAKEDRAGRAYNQAMFRHFLTLERKRFERSGRPFLLLLVELAKPAGSDTRFEPKMAGQLFHALWQCLRETDFAGWYVEGRVAGAVLTQPMEATAGNNWRGIGGRIAEALRDKLAAQIAVRLQVTVRRFPKEHS